MKEKKKKKQEEILWIYYEKEEWSRKWSMNKKKKKEGGRRPWKELACTMKKKTPNKKISMSKNEKNPFNFLKVTDWLSTENKIKSNLNKCAIIELREKKSKLDSNLQEEKKKLIFKFNILKYWSSLFFISAILASFAKSALIGIEIIELYFEDWLGFAVKVFVIQRFLLRLVSYSSNISRHLVKIFGVDIAEMNRIWGYVCLQHYSRKRHEP